MGATFIRNSLLALLTIGLCGCASTGQGGLGRAGTEASNCIGTFDDPHAGIAAAAGLFVCPVEAIVAGLGPPDTAPPPLPSNEQIQPNEEETGSN
jgi:hypothetical protein